MARALNRLSRKTRATLAKLDCSAFFCLLMLAATGALLHWQLPLKLVDATVLGLTRSGWSIIDVGLGIVFVTVKVRWAWVKYRESP